MIPSRRVPLAPRLSPLASLPPPPPPPPPSLSPLSLLPRTSFSSLSPLSHAIFFTLVHPFLRCARVSLSLLALSPYLFPAALSSLSLPSSLSLFSAHLSLERSSH